MKFHWAASFFLLMTFFFLQVISVTAQSAADDSTLYKKAVSNTIALYYKSAGDQLGLYNGIQYGGYPFSFTEGHPFFYSNKPGIGSVVYDGILYENLSMQYDEIAEALFMQDSARRIQLLNPRIERFTLFANNFIRIVKDTESAALVKTGFYNILYEGGTSLLKKEVKLIRDDVSTGELRHFVDATEYYYLKKNNVFFSIKSKGGFLDLFKDKRKQIKQYIAKNKLSYRKDRDNMLAKATAYYDQLTQ